MRSSGVRFQEQAEIVQKAREAELELQPAGLVALRTRQPLRHRAERAVVADEVIEEVDAFATVARS